MSTGANTTGPGNSQIPRKPSSRPAKSAPLSSGTFAALRRISGHMKPYRGALVFAPLFIMGEAGLDLLQPRLVRHIIDEGIAKNDLHTVLVTGGCMVLALVVGALSGLCCNQLAVRSAQHLAADIRGTVLEKIQNLCFGDLDELESSALITRMTSDVSQIQEMLMMFMRGMVRMPMLIIGSTVMAIVTCPRLGVIFIAVLPALAVALVVIVRKAYPLYNAVQKNLVYSAINLET